MKKLFSLLILMFINLSANATVYSYGMDDGKTINSVRVVSLVMEWDVSDETKNPCLTDPRGYSPRKCELEIRVRDGVDYSHHAIYALTSECMIQVKTLGALGTCLSQSTSDYHSNVRNVVLGETTTFDYIRAGLRLTTPYLCVNIRYRTTPTNVGSSEWIQFPNQVCGLMPPPQGVCSTPDLIEFDHGTVSSDFSVSELVQSFNVECNMDFNAAILLTMLDNSSRLKLGDNLYSTLMINGEYATNANKKFNLKTGSNNIEISSRLSRSGEIKSGDYSGQTVMILSMD